MSESEFDRLKEQKRQMEQREHKRFRFVSDDDGHDYLIPADKKAGFDAWLEHQQKLWGKSYAEDEYKKIAAEYTGEDFNDYRIDGHERYSFERPQENA